MAIALVQNSTGVSSGSGSTAPTLPANSTAGNLLVAWICLDNAGIVITAPSGWSLGTNNSTQEVQVWYYQNTVGGQSSFSFTATGATAHGYVAEFSGVATSSARDVFGNTHSGSSSPQTDTTTSNVTNNNSLGILIGGDVESKAGTTTMGGQSGYTTLVAESGSTTIHLIAQYNLSVASGSTASGSVSTTSMNLTSLAAGIVVFKPASGGGGGTPTNLFFPFIM